MVTRISLITGSRPRQKRLNPCGPNIHHLLLVATSDRPIVPPCVGQGWVAIAACDADVCPAQRSASSSAQDTFDYAMLCDVTATDTAHKYWKVGEFSGQVASLASQRR